jgi:hypothetical protein
MRRSSVLAVACLTCAAVVACGAPTLDLGGEAE